MIRIDSPFTEIIDNRTPGQALGLAIVGDISRTWFADRDMLAELLDWLWELDEQLFVAIHGAHGFDLMVEEAVTGMGLRVYHHAKYEGVPWGERFAYKAVDALDVFSEAVCLIVMTRRQQEKGVWEIDPKTVDAAIAHGLPVYALSEEGVLQPWP